MKKLSSIDALKLLEYAENTTTHKGWIIHSKCVGSSAAIIAEKLGLLEKKLEH